MKYVLVVILLSVPALAQLWSGILVRRVQSTGAMLELLVVFQIVQPSVARPSQLTPVLLPPSTTQLPPVRQANS